MANAQEKRHDPIGSVVSVEWLAERLGRDDVLIADCRFDLADAEAGRRAYERDHIPGAVFFDLDDDLSRPATGPGGRHPLPPMDEFAARVGAAGIDDTVTVVCYDDSNGGMAARLWWMLRYAGHKKVALLDGGYGAWQAAGRAVSDEQPTPTPRRFVPRLQPHMVATMADVRAMSEAISGAGASADVGAGVIIDSRVPERFRGEVEPLDPVAGHIPGAINMPWQANSDEDGRFLDDSALAQRFGRVQSRSSGPASASVVAAASAAADAGGDIVVHCGSGVTGCVNVLALERAGLAGVKLYVGGWSEWCSLPDNPVATGDEGEEGSES